MISKPPVRPGAPPAGEALRARGLRLTEPRRAILDVVRATEAHPSAAAVYRRVRRRLPGVSLATVYRNLRILAAQGLLTERPGAAGTRFDGNTSAHDHFTCVVCGRIFDVPPLSGNRLRRAVGSTTGFEVLDHRIEFSGRCGRCRSLPSITRKEDVWQAGISKGRRASRT